MPVWTMDMYQTLALAVFVLLLGHLLRRRIGFLERFCIPPPVIGGLLFALINCALYVSGIVEIAFTDTLREVCMVLFFTSVGFQANLKALKAGGKGILILLGLVVALIVAQNALGIALARALGLDALLGMCTGSIPMLGGHGTAGAFGPVLEDMGLAGATTVCTAAATFGLLAGSLLGGPTANRLIRKNDLLKTASMDDTATGEKTARRKELHYFASASYLLALAAGLGTLISRLLSMTRMTFPVYIGAMIAAAILRNIGEATGKIQKYMGEIEKIGSIMLSLFLGMAMITLKLWQLAALALPLVVLLAGQTILMFLFARYAVFYAMGRDYDAAVIGAGACGFGMGATPNAMANMQAVCDKYAPSPKAFLLVPLVGSLFADFLNSLIITLFINVLH